MSSQVLALRNAIASGLAAHALITDRKVAVSVHGGDFKLEDLKRYSKNAPAVVVAALRTDVSNQPPALLSETIFTAVVVTRPKAGDTRGDQAIEIVDDLFRILARSAWLAGAGSKRPRDLTAKNLFSPEIDGLGVAMWAVQWTQQIDLLDEDNSIPFAAFHADWDLYPREDGADLGDELEAQDDVVIEQDP